MSKRVYSAWWIVYQIDKKTKQPHFLLVKRFALSKKIEWVAPKWKIKPWETQEQAALREIEEEVWLKRENLQPRRMLDTVSLQLFDNDWKIWVDKEITYFLVEYEGNPDDVKVLKWEWYTWVYRRADIKTILNLVTYKDIRELYRLGYGMIKDLTIKDSFIKDL